MRDLEKEFAAALLDVLDGLGALSSPHELLGHGIPLDRATEITELVERAKEVAKWP